MTYVAMLSTEECYNIEHYCIEFGSVHYYGRTGGGEPEGGAGGGGKNFGTYSHGVGWDFFQHILKGDGGGQIFFFFFTHYFCDVFFMIVTLYIYCNMRPQQ